MIRSATLLIAALLWAFPGQAAERVYLSPERFLAEVFQDSPPKPALLWLDAPAQAALKNIFGHAPTQLRQRYWRGHDKTVWILEAVGKEEPITAGFVVSNGAIQQARILIYRESRGMEVRYPAFLRQFEGVRLSAKHLLDTRIDGISGATLSVWAMEKMARAALYLDKHSAKP